MASPAGIAAQIMLAEEGTYGTYQAPTRSIDLVKENVKLQKTKIESKGLRAGRMVLTTGQWVDGKRWAAGDVELELANVNFGLIFKHALGTVVSSQGRSVSDGATTITTPNITSATANFTLADQGRAISGTGIPALTTILSVQSATAATLSANATATGASITFTIGSTGAYVHACTPGDLTGKSLTMQIGKPSISGTVQPFSYTGTKIDHWELSCKAGEIVQIKLGITSQDETTAQALATPAYSSLYAPMTFVGATLLFGGSQVDVADVQLKGNNTLDTQRFRLRNAATPKEQLQNGWREYTGQFTADFQDLTIYNKYQNSQEASLVLTFAAANIVGSSPLVPYQTTITCNVRSDGDTPNVQGPQLLTEPVMFKATASTSSDASAILVQYQTSDSAP